MGLYDSSIVVPVAGQPISVGSYGIPVRDAILDLDERLGVREAAEALPASLNVQGNGVNSLTNTINAWQTLTANPASLVVTNPSSVFNLVCMVYFGGWMQVGAGGGGDLRMGINVTGGVTSDPDPGANSPVGYGLMPLVSSLTVEQKMGMFELIIPAGAAAVTLTAQGRRTSNASTTACQINYPAINVIPWRYQ